MTVMPPPAPESAPGPFPPAPFGPRPEPPRASPWAIVAGLLTVGISWAGFATATGDEGVGISIVAWLGTVVGAAVSATTPIALVFRRITAWLGALVVLMASGLLIGAILQMGGLLAGYVVVGLVFTTASLDLRWTARLRLMVFLSGAGLIPILLHSPGSGLFWVAAWFAGLSITQWLLVSDENDALLKPEAPIPTEAGATRRPIDLLRVLGSALILATFLGLATSAPSCSFQPLARWFPDLPWVPNVKMPHMFGLDLPPYVTVSDYEVDDAGHEVRYELDDRSRRYIHSPLTWERFAVVERDGRDVIFGEDGRVLGRLADDTGTYPGASILVVPRPGDEYDETPGGVRFHRDDVGWYIDDGEGGRFHVGLGDVGWVELTAPDGSVITADPYYDTEIRVGGNPAFESLSSARGMFLPIIDPAVIAATTGTGTEIRRGDRSVTVTEPDGYERRYSEIGRALEVEVRGDEVDLAYRFSEDRSEFDVHEGTVEGRRLGTVRIDRTGSTFDDRREPVSDAGDDREPMSFGSGFRQAAIVLVVALVIGTAIWLLMRRKRGDEDVLADRDWSLQELRRLEDLGRLHGVRRRPGHSVIRFAGALDEELDGDEPGVSEVMLVIDAGLYGSRQIGFEERTTASATIDRIIADNPELDRDGRRERDLARASRGTNEA